MIHEFLQGRRNQKSGPRRRKIKYQKQHSMMQGWRGIMVIDDGSFGTADEVLFCKRERVDIGGICKQMYEASYS